MYPLAALQPLPRSFFLQEPDDVARKLLNCVLWIVGQSGRIIGGRIVETESYTQDDAASHSYQGATKRCKTMFAAGGCAYVYLTYGMYYCINAVTGHANVGSAVLFRALEPYWGLEHMHASRTNFSRGKKHYTVRELCRGPGCLTAALGITRLQDGTQFYTDITSAQTAAKPQKLRAGLYIMMTPQQLRIKDTEIIISPRIGIQKEKEKPARFFIKNNIYVSGKQNS